MEELSSSDLPANAVLISPSNYQIPNSSSRSVSPSSSSINLPQNADLQLGDSQSQRILSSSLFFPRMPPMSQGSGPMSLEEQIRQKFNKDIKEKCSIALQRMHDGKMRFGGQQDVDSEMVRPGMMGHAWQLSMHSSQVAAHDNKQLVRESIPSGSSISAIRPQLSGLPHNGQSVVVQKGNISQQLVMQMQAGIPSQLQQSHIQQHQSTVLQDHISQQQLKQMQSGMQFKLVHLQPHIQQQSTAANSSQLARRSHLQHQQERQQQHAILPQQQFPHAPGFTISKSSNRSQSDIPTSGTNVTYEIISQGIFDVLHGKSTIQDLVSQVHGHLCKKRPKLVHCRLCKKRLKLTQLLQNKRLKQVRELKARRKASDAAKRLEAIQPMDSMVKSKQLSPAASSPVLQELPQP